MATKICNKLVSEQIISEKDFDVYVYAKVRIKGAYKNMAYTSGDVTIKWSPDTYGSVPSLN